MAREDADVGCESAPDGVPLSASFAVSACALVFDGLLVAGFILYFLIRIVWSACSIAFQDFRCVFLVVPADSCALASDPSWSASVSSVDDVRWSSLSDSARRRVRRRWRRLDAVTLDDVSCILRSVVSEFDVVSPLIQISSVPLSVAPTSALLEVPLMRSSVRRSRERMLRRVATQRLLASASAVSRARIACSNELFWSEWQPPLVAYVYPACVSYSRAWWSSLTGPSWAFSTRSSRRRDRVLFSRSSSAPQTPVTCADCSAPCGRLLGQFLFLVMVYSDLGDSFVCPGRFWRGSYLSVPSASGSVLTPDPIDLTGVPVTAGVSVAGLSFADPIDLSDGADEDVVGGPIRYLR